ncbi:Pyridoxal kinase; AltName: Full=Protein SALT OVERLY SENSITIVE 4; AltName: Full=Pyridoxal kinase-like protein SOS4; AltName: Full=Pyridoxine kinase; Contains: RecName: Full=Pyridoxal kinase, N-terminally processed [Serendipita indica DSM 11827]|uniref:pyridoxal kinase n=1 Tax=Serendipita indica (strain DSM 11827) TaxID=1109443 RepID=G4THG0_SERID|nr:Pyridoxal kinase; AltName: Full=Protein SALT OVERLY SENSITIVE 4; AltName: Full=Pyridoxal kinase-like protein SOS4; AltName: Full=Pyridoxine kinase; Contains: RecName: Full=Pyridoxal kinase, N-terminally processed [Serendipita indica DSM 11827]CCA70743.1 related to pyridoxal kinase [Serendipita indica DSM 11827]
MDPLDRTILSVQSHVTHGYVGGRAATFPLQLLGWDVDVLNTVNFSNHSGYRRRPGEGARTTGKELDAIVHGLEMNDLLHPARLLTGYIPNADCLSAVVRLVEKLRTRNPKLIYLLDPVLGDNNRLYVSPDVVPLYRNLLCTATIITPNWFEVETLVGFPLSSMEALRNALHTLHGQYGVPHVVISSIPITAERAAWLPDSGDYLDPPENDLRYASEDLLCVASIVSDGHSTSTVYTARIRQVAGYLSGVGDLFSALVLGYYDPHTSQTALCDAVVKAIRTTHALVRRTMQTSKRASGADVDGYTDEELDSKDEDRRARRMKARELRIIGNNELILSAGGSQRQFGPEMQHWEAFWVNG